MPRKQTKKEVEQWKPWDTKNSQGQVNLEKVFPIITPQEK